ncbi:MAG: zinc dependent phospholipase C family protein [Gemmatimonadales bacterium]
MRPMLRSMMALLLAAMLPVSMDAAEPDPLRPSVSAVRADKRWKINTHLFAANQAIADALNDGMVTIHPFGEIPVAASALRALKAAPSSYRAGVLAPDLFPDMWMGGWFIHSDRSNTEKWTADDWMRHVWTKARAWPDPAERDKVMAFAYGFLTHGAGDMFAHTYVNQKADGAWITFTGPARSTAVKHVVLEGFIGANTPATDLTIDVWPRFVSNVLIKDPTARRHAKGAVHYQRFMALYDWLGPQVDKAAKQMNNNVGSDAPYWAKCAANPIPCAKKEQMETWRLDINRGLRALVDSSESLGENLMDHQVAGGTGAMSGWMTEWLPKMFGAHAIGEGAAELQAFLQWIGDPLAPINAAIMAEVKGFLKQQFPAYYELYLAVKDPATQMDNVGFPPGTTDSVRRDMGIAAGATGGFDWRTFEPMYNTVILSKLALLDGNGLNELARRAGVAAPLFAPGEDTNVMLGVFRSMTQSFQWKGEVITTDTKFGICGAEDTGAPLDSTALCGAQRTSGPVPAGARSAVGGFVLWSNPDAREKVFGRVFKGHGPGPGSTSLTAAMANLTVAAPAVRNARRALRVAVDQTELMREIVLVMRGKIGGVGTTVSAAAAPPAAVPAAVPSVAGRPAASGRVPVKPVPVAQPSTPAPATPVSAAAIADWGRRCCSRDIAELQAALAQFAGSGRQLQTPAVLGALGRSPAVAQLGGYAGQVNAAITAFANTRNAAEAATALDALARQIEGLARLAAGTQ